MLFIWLMIKNIQLIFSFTSMQLYPRRTCSLVELCTMHRADCKEAIGQWKHVTESWLIKYKKSKINHFLSELFSRGVLNRNICWESHWPLQKNRMSSICAANYCKTLNKHLKLYIISALDVSIRGTSQPYNLHRNPSTPCDGKHTQVLYQVVHNLFEFVIVHGVCHTVGRSNITTDDLGIS